MADPTLVSNPELTEQIKQLNTLLSQLSEGGSHLVTGGMAAHALEWIKNKPGVSKYWTQFADRTKTVISAIVATAAGVGIVFTFKHDPHGDFILVAHNLTWATFGIFIWSALQNFLWQQGWYMTVIKPKPVVGPAPPVIAEPVPVVVAPVVGGH